MSWLKLLASVNMHGGWFSKHVLILTRNRRVGISWYYYNQISTNRGTRHEIKHLSIVKKKETIQHANLYNEKWRPYRVPASVFPLLDLWGHLVNHSWKNLANALAWAVSSSSYPTRVSSDSEEDKSIGTPSLSSSNISSLIALCLIRDSVSISSGGDLATSSWKCRMPEKCPMPPFHLFEY